MRSKWKKKKKKKERGDARSPRTLTYVTALDSFRCATPRVTSSNRIVFFKTRINLSQTTQRDHRCSVSIFLNQPFDILFTRCVNKNTSHKKKRKRKRPRYHSERTGKLINARDNPSTSNDLRHCTLYLAQLQLSSAHERCVTLPSERRPPCIDCCIRLHQTLTPSTRTATIIPSRIRPTTNETNHQHSSPRPLPILLASIYSDSRRTNPLSSPRYRHQMRQT